MDLIIPIAIYRRYCSGRNHERIIRHLWLHVQRGRSFYALNLSLIFHQKITTKSREWVSAPVAYLEIITYIGWLDISVRQNAALYICFKRNLIIILMFVCSNQIDFPYRIIIAFIVVGFYLVNGRELLSHVYLFGVCIYYLPPGAFKVLFTTFEDKC